MFDYSDIIETILDDNMDAIQAADDIDNIDVDFYIHMAVDTYVSGLDFKDNKTIIEDDFKKDVFEVMADYNDEYGDIDLKRGKIQIYAVLAFFCITNYTNLRDEVELRINAIINDDYSDDSNNSQIG